MLSHSLQAYRGEEVRDVRFDQVLNVGIVKHLQNMTLALQPESEPVEAICSAIGDISSAFITMFDANPRACSTNQLSFT